MSRRTRAGIGAVLLLAIAVALASHIISRMAASPPASPKREVAVQATTMQAAPVETAFGSRRSSVDRRDAEPASAPPAEPAAPPEPTAERPRLRVQPAISPRPTTTGRHVDERSDAANPSGPGGTIARFAMAPTEEGAEGLASDSETPSSPLATEPGPPAPAAPAAAPPEQAAIRTDEPGSVVLRPDEPNAAALAEPVPPDPAIRAEAVTASAERGALPATAGEGPSSPPIVVAIDPPGPVAGLSPPAIAPRTEIKRQAPPVVETPPPPRQAASAAAPSDQRELDQILSRAHALMRGRDFRAARSLLELVIDASPEASFMIAQTFDRRQIKARRVRGVEADHLRARAFYERAAKGGVPGAAQSLSGLED